MNSTEDVSQLSAQPEIFFEVSQSRTRDTSNKELKVPMEAVQYYKGTSSQGDELWEIESVLKKKFSNGKAVWLVKWKGWPIEDATWEPRSSFCEDPNLLMAQSSNRRGKKQSQTLSKPPPTPKQRQSAKKSTEDHRLEVSASKEDLHHCHKDKGKEGDSNSVSTEETNNRPVSCKSTPLADLQLTKDILPSKSATSHNYAVTDEDWRKSEVRIAVQGNRTQVKPTPSVVVPSDLDTEHFLRNSNTPVVESDNTNRLLYEDNRTNMMLPMSSLAKERTEDDYWFGGQSSMQQFSEQPINEFDYSFVNPSIGASRHIPGGQFFSEAGPELSVQKRVCKESDKQGVDDMLFNYTIQEVDYIHGTMKIFCTYKSNGEPFYTKWLNIEQLSKICPTQALDFLLEMGSFNLRRQDAGLGPQYSCQ